MEKTTSRIKEGADFFAKYLSTSMQCTSLFVERGDHVDVSGVALAIAEAFKSGKKLLVAGNGGSAADAQHIAAEFVGRMSVERQALPAIALTTDSSALTALGNDYGFTNIFARQVEALGNQGDVFLGISTSGNSANVCIAADVCRDMGVQTVALVGEDKSCLLASSADYLISAPSRITSHVQEMHIKILHGIAELVDRIFHD